MPTTTPRPAKLTPTAQAEQDRILAIIDDEQATLTASRAHVGPHTTNYNHYTFDIAKLQTLRDKITGDWVDPWLSVKTP